MKKHRLFSLILSALILTSCGGAAADPAVTSDTPDTTTEPIETDPEYIYPDKDYGGHEFGQYPVRHKRAYVGRDTDRPSESELSEPLRGVVGQRRHRGGDDK